MEDENIQYTVNVHMDGYCVERGEGGKAGFLVFVDFVVRLLLQDKR